jgi:hypothetical protein
LEGARQMGVQLPGHPNHCSPEIRMELLAVSPPWGPGEAREDP